MGTESCSCHPFRCVRQPREIEAGVDRGLQELRASGWDTALWEIPSIQPSVHPLALLVFSAHLRLWHHNHLQL